MYVKKMAWEEPCVRDVHTCNICTQRKSKLIPGIHFGE